MNVKHTRYGDYHTALKSDSSETVEVSPETEFEYGRIHAFVHDLLDGYDPRFDQADAVYSEPPWKAGFDKFMSLAGKEGDFNRYLESVRDVCRRFGKPCYLVCGKAMFRGLDADEYRPVYFSQHGQRVFLAVYNEPSRLEIPSTAEAVDMIATRYGCVLDFSCGCAGRFLDSRVPSNFILSDVNPDCIGYIKNKVMEDAQRWLT